MKRFFFLLPAFLIPHLVYSQTPPPELIVNPETPLQQAIDQQLQVYAEGGRPEVLKTSNAIIYPFGVYQPVLTCAILRLCVIELEPGEVLLSLGAGDHVRWNIDHGTTGPGGSTIYITISPTDFNLTTNLVISTDRRMYHMTLDSPPRKHGPDSQNPMPGYTRHVMFYYPSKHHVVSQPAEKPNTSTVGTNLDDLNYGYTWRAENDFPWVPLAVFDDGERVYLRIPDGIDPGAVLLIGDANNSRLGSYILRDDFLIIDRVFDEARIVLPGPQKRRRFLRRNRQPQRVLILSRT